MNRKIQTATLAGGCFWCTEAIFMRLKGVLSVVPGYVGGTIRNPTYEQVCSGKTGHAEAIRIKFDPEQIPYEKILDVFWHTHDPITYNRQGSDIGPQYRSAIFYHDSAQKRTAELSKAKLEKEKVFAGPVVTEITPFTDFYPAEDYHMDYYGRNKNESYYTFIIHPKIIKLINLYSRNIKDEYMKQ